MLLATNGFPKSGREEVRFVARKTSFGKSNESFPHPWELSCGKMVENFCEYGFKAKF